MNTEHDRATKVADNRIDQHLPIVRRNRHNLSNLVIVPKPPATPHEPPREFRYIEPTQEEIDQAQPSSRQPTPQPSKPSKKEAKPRTPSPPPTPPLHLRQSRELETRFLTRMKKSYRTLSKCSMNLWWSKFVILKLSKKNQKPLRI